MAEMTSPASTTTVTLPPRRDGNLSGDTTLVHSTEVSSSMSEGSSTALKGKEVEATPEVHGHHFPPRPFGASEPGYHSSSSSQSPHAMSAAAASSPPNPSSSFPPKMRAASLHSRRSSVAPEDNVFGTAPVGMIGKHKPREILRVERDYSAGEICQFWSGWIWELEGRISPTAFQNTLNELNTVLASAHDPYKSCFDNTLAVLTLYISPHLFGTHYQREMRKFDRIMERANRDIYNPAGLNILSPKRTAFLFLEIEYY